MLGWTNAKVEKRENEESYCDLGYRQCQKMIECLGKDYKNGPPIWVTIPRELLYLAHLGRRLAGKANHYSSDFKVISSAATLNCRIAV